MKTLLLSLSLVTAAHAHHDGVLTPQALPVLGHFDGDGVRDRGVYLDGVWYLFTSSDGQVTRVDLGEPGDIPLVADMDGDGLDDLVVFTPSTRTYKWLRSTFNYAHVPIWCEHLAQCLVAP